MQKTTFDQYLEERYFDQMKYYSASASKNQKKYKKFQWILIILTALTPVIAALNGFKFTQGETMLSNMNLLVVIISSVVAILTTGLKTFNYQELWITYRSTYEKLKPEIYYYNFNIGDYGLPNIDKESLFVARIEAMLDSEHNQWPPAKKLNENNNKPADETQDQPAGEKEVDAKGDAPVVKEEDNAPVIKADSTATVEGDSTAIADAVNEPITKADADSSSIAEPVAEPSANAGSASIENADSTPISGDEDIASTGIDPKRDTDK